MPTKKIDVFGTDQLMNNSFPYYLLAFIMSLAVLLDTLSIPYLLIFIIYTVLPLLDEYLSFDIRNPNEK